MKYVKKPIIVDAILWNDDEKSYIGLLELGAKEYITVRSNGSLGVHTLEGTMNCPVGHYVIKGITGEFYPCQPDIFEQTYEGVD